jgi:hypothetical protein
MKRTVSERFALKLAQFRAVARHPSGRKRSDLEAQWAKDRERKKKLKWEKRRRRALKLDQKDEIKAVLRMAKEILKRERAEEKLRRLTQWVRS